MRAAEGSRGGTRAPTPPPPTAAHRRSPLPPAPPSPKPKPHACPPPPRRLSNFYERLKEVRDYHRRFPVHDVTGPEDDGDALKEEPQVPFTGEEGLGR
jgi:hypothetical protein